MQSPRADRVKLAEAASNAARRFDTWGQSLAAAPAKLSIAQLLDRMNEEARHVDRPNWDSAAQLYLALVAMHYAKHGTQAPPRNDPLTRSLRETREQLMFPSPSGGERRFDSPRELDPVATVRERLLPEIERLLRE
jgi:hypothetical protein